jgi:hypothetical protein
MGQYGKTAIQAALYVKSGMSAENAWDKAVHEIIQKKSSQDKMCPRNAFYGLFSKIPDNSNGKNAEYAKRALTILQNHPEAKYTTKELWLMTLNGEQKAHNQQMDVVLSLWLQKLI